MVDIAAMLVKTGKTTKIGKRLIKATFKQMQQTSFVKGNQQKIIIFRVNSTIKYNTSKVQSKNDIQSVQCLIVV